MSATTDPQQPDREPEVPPRSRRRPSALLLGVTGALVALVAVLVVTALRGGDDAEGTWDLSTPESAAEAFATTAAAGDVEGLLAVTCLGNDGCAAEHGGGVTAEQVSVAKRVIANNVRTIGRQFQHAQFTTVRDGAEPGTREVDYRLPDSPPGERNYLVFVEHGGRWFYIATGSGANDRAPASPSPEAGERAPAN